MAHPYSTVTSIPELKLTLTKVTATNSVHKNVLINLRPFLKAGGGLSGYSGIGAGGSPSYDDTYGSDQSSVGGGGIGIGGGYEVTTTESSSWFGSLGGGGGDSCEVRLEALEVESEARFGLRGPSYLLGPVYEAEIGLIEAVLDPKS